MTKSEHSLDPKDEIDDDLQNTEATEDAIERRRRRTERWRNVLLTTMATPVTAIILAQIILGNALILVQSGAAFGNLTNSTHNCSFEIIFQLAENTLNPTVQITVSILSFALSLTSAIMVFIGLAIKWRSRSVYEAVLIRVAYILGHICFCRPRTEKERRKFEADNQRNIRVLWTIMECYYTWKVLFLIIINNLVHFKLMDGDMFNSVNDKIFCMLCYCYMLIILCLLICTECVRVWPYCPWSRPYDNEILFPPPTGFFGTIRSQVEAMWQSQGDHQNSDLMLHCSLFFVPMIQAAPIILTLMHQVFIDLPLFYFFLYFVVLPYPIYLSIRLILVNLRLCFLETRIRIRNRGQSEAIHPTGSSSVQMCQFSGTADPYAASQ